MADAVTITVDGAPIQVPADATPEEMQQAADAFVSSPDYDKIIDKKTGAPAWVRMQVGSAAEQDKTDAIRRFYPNARQYGDGNFVFTDPNTGRPTLYNPEGIDAGDVASVAKEGFQAVGSGMGAAFGAAGGMALGVVGGPPAMAAAGSMGAATGAGMGNAVAGSMFDIAMELIAGRPDSRSVPRRVVDTALDFGGGAVGQRVGELAEAGVKRALGGGRAAVQNLVDAFKSFGIQPPAGAVTGNRAMQTIEKTLEASPVSGTILQKQAEQVLSQTKAAADDLAQKFGQSKTQQGAGEAIREAAKATAERFGFRQEQIYDDVVDMIGANTPVQVNAVKALRQKMEGELARAPRSLEPALKSAMQMLREIELDAAGQGGVPFQAMREIRTMVGKDIDAPILAGSTGAQNEALKRVYGALSEDIKEAAKAAGPEAAKKLAVADRYTRLFMSTASKTMQKLADFDADEKAFSFAMQSAKDGGTALARMRRHFTPDEWDTVAGTVLGRMGLARPGAQDAAGEAFSVNTFMTNWNKLAPEAREALFGGKRYAELAPALDRLVSVIDALKGAEKLANTSNTARTMLAFSTISTLGGALGGLAGGDPQSVATGVLGSIVAPRVAAKLITSPRFVNWLTDAATNPTGLSAQIGRLSEIGVAEPWLQGEIEQYVQALRSVPTVTPAVPKP